MFYNKKTVFLLLSIICFGFTTFTNTENEWVLKKQGEGVSIYSRGVETSAIRELKAVTQIKTSLSSFVALIFDRESYPQWVYKCDKSYTIKTISNVEAICYQNVVAPWPLDNRDIVLDVTVEQNSSTKVIYITSISKPDYIPKAANHVRVIEFTASWKLTPLKNGMVNCEYQLLFNPGGNVPSWIVNIAAIDGPFETTINMRKILMKEKYQKANYDFITEP